MDERLRKFARLVELRSFTSAAADLHISQPALSTTIRNLERELGCQLLVREGRRLRITAAGKLVYATAKDLEDKVHNLKRGLSTLSNQEPAITLGMIDGVAQAFVHSDNFGYLQASQTEITLTVDNSAQLIAAVDQGRMDAAFITKQRQELPGALQEQPAGTEPLVLVTTPVRSCHAEKDLAAGVITDFISYNQASTTHQQLSEVFSANAVTARTVFYSTSPGVMLQIVLSGKGVAALPYIMVAEQLRSGTLVPLYIRNMPVIERTVCFIQRKNRTTAKAVERILDHTRQALAALHSQARAGLPSSS